MDIAPYNSLGTQSFRTLLSTQIGTQRPMLPLDGFMNPLPPNPLTVLRGFVNITNHPDRAHKHEYYRLNLTDSELQSLNPMKIPNSIPIPLCSSLDPSKPTEVVAKNGNFGFSWSSLKVPQSWSPHTDVDSNDVYALLNAFPMKSDGVHQNYIVWVSMFFAFSRSGVTFESFWLKQPRKCYARWRKQ